MVVGWLKLEKAKKVVALELDTRLIPVLEDTLGDFDNVEVINADVMKIDLKKLIEELDFKCVSGEKLLDKEPKWAYVSDLLSDVMGKAQPQMIWITSQIHKNIVAVASLIELSAIVIVNERKPDEDMLKLAEEEGVVVLTSDKPAFETTGMLYEYLTPAP